MTVLRCGRVFRNARRLVLVSSPKSWRPCWRAQAANCSALLVYCLIAEAPLRLPEYGNQSR